MTILKHIDIWRAIDLLAAQNGLSASGLALKAGLSATSFNPTKRAAGKRKRWPSTESIALILKATDTTLEQFAALAGSQAAPRDIPLIHDSNLRPNAFDPKTRPIGKAWGKHSAPALPADCFALKITTRIHEPVYRKNDILICAPLASPRSGDRIALSTTEGMLIVGEFDRQTKSAIGLQLFNGETVNLRLETIAGRYKILWAGQAR